MYKTEMNDMRTLDALCISLFLTFLFSFLILQRGAWGTDFENYIALISESEGDFLFRTLTSWIFQFSGSAVLALNSLVLLALGLKVYHFNKILGFSSSLILLLLIPDIIAKDFGTIRQGLAIAILLPMICLNLEKIGLRSGGYYLLLVVIASLFHWSAFFMAMLHCFIIYCSKNIKLTIAVLLFAAGGSIHLPEIVRFLSETIPSGFLAYKIERYFHYDDPYTAGRLFSMMLSIAEMTVLLGCVYFCTNAVRINQLSLTKRQVVLYILLTKMLIIFIAAPQLTRVFNFVNICAIVYVGILVIRTRSDLRAPMYISLLMMGAVSSIAYISRYPDEFTSW